MAGMDMYMSVRVKDAEAYRALSEEVVAFVADNEPGTTAYQWHLSEDGTSGFHVDRFDSTESFLTHVSNAQEHGYLERFVEVVDIERVIATGSPTDAAEPVLQLFGAEVLETVGSI